MEALEALKGAENAAQAELAQAEIALIEASARAQDAREAHAKLAAALAALTGEPPPAAIPTQNGAVHTQIGEATAPITPIHEDTTPSTPERAAMADMTPEQFDAERKRRQRQRKKEEEANNPYAHIKCSGCGAKGTMQDVVMQAPSGAPVRMMTCTGCGNQLMQ